MPTDEKDKKSLEAVDRINYWNNFDRTINHIGIEAFGENDIVSGLIIHATYIPILRRAAADAGIKVGINAYEAAKIFLMFEAVKFGKQKSIIDKILGRNKDIEKIHVHMCNKAIELYMDSEQEVMFEWGAAYVDFLKNTA